MAKTADKLNRSNIVLSTTDYRVVGTRPIRHDGVDKVTGRAIYGADFKLPGLLHGRVLRSPHAHARIKGIDTSKAAALAGVRAVVTGKDLPEAEGAPTSRPSRGSPRAASCTRCSRRSWRTRPCSAVSARPAS